jgi:DNA polymerase III subunit delta'
MSLYPWLESSYALWTQSITQESVPAATILVSKAGMGAETLVKEMAASVLCKVSTVPCGSCHDCHLFAADNHPDYHHVIPEKGAKSISVDQIRAINRLSQESSQLGGFRVISITPANTMNESAANALLKTLEEPPSDCCFILSATQVRGLLPTIISRCRQIHVPEPAQDKVMEWASTELSHNIAPYIVKLNGSSPLLVLEFVKSNQDKSFELLANGFTQFLEQPDAELLAMTKLLSQDAELSLTWLWYLLTDAQKYHFAIDQLDAIPHSAKVSQLCSYPLLYAQTKSLTALVKLLRAFSGLNSELLITDWLLKFKG